jgi:hypothetical protein
MRRRLELGVVVTELQHETLIFVSLHILGGEITNDYTVGVDSRSNALSKFLICQEGFLLLEFGLKARESDLEVWRLVHGMFALAGV